MPVEKPRTGLNESYHFIVQQFSLIRKNLLKITYLATGDGARGFSGRLGCSATGRSRPFPGGGTGFLGGTTGAAFAGFSGRDLSTF